MGYQATSTRFGSRSAISWRGANSGESVEVGCLGGHGRTGTALACLAILTGTPSPEAVTWVRTNYCGKAVETDEQVAFVGGFSR